MWGCNYSGYIPFNGTVKELKAEIAEYRKYYNIEVTLNHNPTNNIYENNEFDDLEVEEVYASRGGWDNSLVFCITTKEETLW